MTSSPSQRLELARQYLAERASRNPKLTPSRTFVNSTTTGLYTGNRMQSARDGANDFQQVQSAPIAAQIRRVQA